MRRDEFCKAQPAPVGNKACADKGHQMMKADIKRAWCEELESGNYEQARNRWGGKGKSGYCCLQVLREEVLGLSGEIQLGIGAYERELYDAGLKKSQVNLLIKMNDKYLKTFPEIAEWVRENVRATP